LLRFFLHFSSFRSQKLKIFVVLCVVTILTPNVSSTTISPNTESTGGLTGSFKAQKQMPRIESVAHAFHGAFGFNMPKRIIFDKREKRGDKKLTKKHNKPKSTATPRQIPFCLPPPTPKPTKPVRFALNGKTLFASYDWGN
jgi:hypothetical protein